MSAIGPGSADQVVMFSVAFVLYDHAITLPSEVSLIWGRKWSSVTLLFYLNRWATFIWAVVQVPLDMLPLSRLPVSCIGLHHITGSTTFLLFVAVFSSMRIYALSGGNRWLALIVLLLNLVPVATNISIFANWQYEIVDLPVLRNDCYGGSTLSQSVQIKKAVATGTRGCVIVADVMVLVVTWNRTYSTYRHARIAHARTPLVTVVLRDGARIFFVSVLLLLNVLNMIGLGTNRNPTSRFSSVIITHFLLNLRQTSSVVSDGNVAHLCTSSHSRLSSNHSFVDNMGAELDYEGSGGCF
ncbi:hypothetical protein CERSUDRAFT_68193 [Gelatoporia subvermispora B]|uniref:DUF6533 domain-containing protein n=1 Tax=Ceriporiopsis subvermispora (strain B) TaxID=914234 RepID=M2QLU8_CERS8|nr:hypothetical protein CERSUDRAFT_68193 [Gelatoporia subvermispora B]